MDSRKKFGLGAEQKGESGVSWMLFREADGPDDPLKFFNNCLYELSGGEIFNSEKSLYQSMTQKSVCGMPYVVEVGIEKNTLTSMIRKGEYAAIATAVMTMNDKKVTFENGKFTYVKAELNMSK